MKTFAVALAVASLSILAVAAAEPAVKLTGIAQLSDGAVMLLEISHPGGGAPLKPILEAGERVQDIEVVSIDPKAATALIKQGSKTTEFSVGAGGNTAKAPTVNFKEADSRQVLDIYQRASGRTVIASSVLPVARVTVTSDVDPAGAVGRALKDQGIVVTPRSDKFAFATAPSNVERLAQIRQPPVYQSEPKPGQLRPGLIKFDQAGLNQFLDIYQELAGLTLLRAANLPDVKVTVRSQTELSRAEALWLMESVLHLEGITATFRFDKVAFITRLDDTARLAQIKEPPAPSNDPNVERFPAGLIKFSGADLNLVLDIYQELTGRTLLPAPNLPAARISVKSQTPLTRDEAAWLLESALQLGGIRLVAVGDKQLKVLFETRPDHYQN